MDKSSLLMKTIVLFFILFSFSVFSWISGKSVIGYKFVDKRENPRAYWAATIIISLLSLLVFASGVNLLIERVR